MASTINSTGTSSGIVSTADASGVLNLQGGGNTGISIDATGVPTVPSGTLSVRRVLGTYGVDIAVNNATGNTTISTAGAGAVLTIASPTISGVLTGVGSQSATTFLGPASVQLATYGTVYDIINTGSIGANGQVWQITFIAAIYNTATSDFVEAAIYNGSTYIANYGGYTVGTQGQCLVVTKVVTLTGATTFTGRAKAGNTNSYIVTTGNATLASNVSTSITAVRLA